MKESFTDKLKKAQTNDKESVKEMTKVSVKEMAKVSVKQKTKKTLPIPNEIDEQNDDDVRENISIVAGDLDLGVFDDLSEDAIIDYNENPVRHADFVDEAYIETKLSIKLLLKSVGGHIWDVAHHTRRTNAETILAYFGIDKTQFVNELRENQIRVRNKKA